MAVSKEDKFDFEAGMKRLEEISRRMGGDDLSLDDSIGLYSEAVELGRKCRAYIDNARLTVEKLEGKDGKDEG